MKIRAYTPADLEAIRRMHRDSGLPENCFPDVSNPLFVVKSIASHEGRPIAAAFVKLVGEGFILVDHSYAHPGERLDALERLITAGLAEASDHVQEVSAWLPPEVQKSFGPRLESLGFVKSPWPSWTALLR